MIRIENAGATYPDGSRAFGEVSFSVEKGECVALTGDTGSGKTSLMLAMVGILPLNAGKIMIDSLEVKKENYPKIRERVGFLFQNPDHQLFCEDVYEDVRIGAESDEIAREVMEELGIYHLKNRAPGRLSGGEKRKVALATILACKPQILLLDEPSTYLDEKSHAELCRILRALPQTKLIATHDKELIHALCSRRVTLPAPDAL